MLGKHHSLRTSPCIGSFVAASPCGLTHLPHEVLPKQVIESIRAHLGGPQVLARVGAGHLVADHDHVCFVLTLPNPAGVHTVVITVEPHGFYRMDCYGARMHGGLTAPLVASATQILPENLATVLGRLTGIETIHHHHY